jgi:hypothetical protein
MLTLRL